MGGPNAIQFEATWAQRPGPGDTSGELFAGLGFTQPLPGEQTGPAIVRAIVRSTDATFSGGVRSVHNTSVGPFGRVGIRRYLLSAGNLDLSEQTTIYLEPFFGAGPAFLKRGEPMQAVIGCGLAIGLHTPYIRAAVGFFPPFCAMTEAPLYPVGLEARAGRVKLQERRSQPPVVSGIGDAPVVAGRATRPIVLKEGETRTVRLYAGLAESNDLTCASCSVVVKTGPVPKKIEVSAPPLGTELTLKGIKVGRYPVILEVHGGARPDLPATVEAVVTVEAAATAGAPAVTLVVSGDPATSGAFSAALTGNVLTIKGPADQMATVAFYDSTSNLIAINPRQITTTPGEIKVTVDPGAVAGATVEVLNIHDRPAYTFKLLSAP